MSDMSNETKQNRFKSPAVLLSMLALILPLLGLWGLYDVMGITEDKLQYTITTVIELLVIVGILNNPTDKNNF